MNISVDKAAQALRAAQDILILTHRRPDGDTAGSGGALCLGLRQIGKTAYILDNPDITPRYAPLIAGCYPPADFVPRYIVSVDIADVGLLTPNAEEYRDGIDLVIDHHPSNPAFGKQNLIRATAGACAEVVYDLLLALDVTLTIDIATAVYVGTSTDTGCFRYSNTGRKTHEVAAACLSAGVDGGEINRALFETKSHARFNMECIVFASMEFLRNGRIALATLRRTDIERTGADQDDLDSIAALTRQVEGVQVGITITENTDGTVKLSVRTTKEVDASAICRKLGGGGHFRAAGASLECGVAEAREAILRAAEEVYDASELA